MNLDILNFMKEEMPFEVDDIYLKNNAKQIKAVCSNAAIAKFLANCVNSFKDISDSNIDRIKTYQQLIQSCVYLKDAILKANIPINTIELMFVEKAFKEFCKQLSSIKGNS